MKLLHTPTVCSIARLVVALQVLMTLGMPLRTTTTTTALPVTSKPIESTAENLAWQAWIMLPPEQKQLIKSRKVTPKSIFTLPLRVECPEGHQQVDMKCIPTAIGSNSVLIDPNVLGLVLGDAPVDIEYDYEDETQEGNFPYNPPLYLSDTDKSNSDAVLELKPPSKDEPLKFNIFQSKFPTDDYPMEDYSSISNEGGLQAPAMGEKEVNHTETEESHSQTHNQIPANVNLVNESFNTTFNVQEQDLLSEASSNVSKAQSLTGLTESSAFSLDNLEAISLSASSPSQAEKSQTFSLFNEDAAIHLVTSIMDTESSEGESKEMSTTQQNQENDLEVLLQTESLMPMLNQTTASTILPAESLALTSASLEEPQSSSSKVSETFALHLEDIEEMTTLIPNVMEGQREMEEHEDKVEYIRSVTMNPLYSDSVEGDEDEATTLTPSTGYDELSEMQEGSESVETTTMPAATIQLDETTIIEGVNDEVLSSNDETTTTLQPETTSSSSFAALQSSTQTPEELQEMLRQQEQAVQDFEELQRMRKGQITDQHTVQQKSKVEPVEVSAALSATTTASQSAAETTMPAESTTTKTTATTMDELITTETVTPLLTVHNNDSNSNSNDNTKTNNIEHNNDRFYYQHFAKQDLESAALVSGAVTTKAAEETSTSKPIAATATMSSSNTATVDWETTSPATTTASTTAATSEIDLAEELRLINELVKGKRPGTSSTTTTTTTVDTSSAKPAVATTTTKTSTEDDETNISSSTSSSSASSSSAPKPSESSATAIKYSLETTQIWSKIMPLIKTTAKTSTTTTTTTTTSTPANSETTTENSSTSAATAQEEETTAANNKLIASNRSHRNSKIIRINGFNSIDTNPKKSSVTPQTTETARTTTTEDISTTTDEENETSSSSASSTAAADTPPAAAAADAYEPFWWLPIAWRLDTPSTTTKKPEQSNHSNDDDMPLLLRFWSTYHAPKSS